MIIKYSDYVIHIKLAVDRFTYASARVSSYTLTFAVAVLDLRLRVLPIGLQCAVMTTHLQFDF